MSEVVEITQSNSHQTTSSNNAIMRCENISKSFNEGELHVDVLKQVNLSVASAEIIAIVGTSGSGKSTLLHILGGLDSPSTGNVWIKDTDINKINETQRARLRNKHLGFIYQFHHLLTEFNALENVAMPLLIRGLKPRDAEERSADIIDKVGLSQRMKHRIGELSGGERQRIAIARALVSEPICVLADEPTGNLDNKTAAQVFELMLELNQTLATSFIMVTHDLTLAEKTHRTLHLEDGVLRHET